MGRMFASKRAFLGIVNVGLALVLLAAVLSCGGAAPSASAPAGAATPSGAAAKAAPAKVFNLRYAAYTPQNWYATDADEWWAKEVERRTGGQVKVQFFYTESLLKAADILPGVAKGLSEMGWAASGYYPALLPTTAGLELPYQVVAPDTHQLAITELYETYAPFRQEWESQGIKIIHFQSLGPTILHSKMPITSLDDLKSKRIRGFGQSNSALEMLGAVPVGLASPEIYTALERGTLDGYTGMPFDAIFTFKYQEVAKYLTDPGLGQYVTAAIVMNRDLYNSLPDDVKKAMDEVNKEFPAKMLELLKNQEDTNGAKLREAGVKFAALPPQELQKWRAKVVPMLWDKWAADATAKGIPAKETLDRYTKLVEKYASQSKYVSAVERFAK